MNGRLPGRRPTPAARPIRPGAMRVGVRPGGGYRRIRPVRRASARMTPVRAGALLVLLLGGAGLYGAATSDAFAVRRTVVTGAGWTSEADLLAAAAIPEGQNLFAFQAAGAEARLEAIPAIRNASVTVALPDEIRISVVEREALVAWQVGDRAYLVDATGLLFGQQGATAPEGPALPLVDDLRSASADLGTGSVLDPVSLDAALRLGSLVPADLESAATSLRIRVDDEDGFVVRGMPVGWTAIFGFYTPTLRTTELIPGQVRLLKSLLYGREEAVLQVILADDRSATYVPRPSAKPSAKPSPTPRP